MLRQDSKERLIYFSRPGDSVPLKALTDDSAVIAEAVITSKKDFDSAVTVLEWFTKRIIDKDLQCKESKGQYNF